MIPPYEGWKPYCLKCSTMDRMSPIEGGFYCATGCGNKIGLDMRRMVEVSASMVRSLREKTDCGLMEAKTALQMRNGNMEFAEEYVKRAGLAAVMSDKARFPLWYAFLEQS